MSGTKAEGILEQLKKITKLKLAQKAFAPFSQLYKSFRTPDIRQQ